MEITKKDFELYYQPNKVYSKIMVYCDAFECKNSVKWRFKNNDSKCFGLDININKKIYIKLNFNLCDKCYEELSEDKNEEKMQYLPNLGIFY